VVPSSALLDPLRKGIESGRRTLVSVTAEVEITDPVAVAFASRLASDRWFCWEQPDRDFALVGIGVAHEAASRGSGRFEDVAQEVSRVTRGRVCEEPRGLPAGAGPVWVGGFAFDPEGGASPTWSSLSPASLVLPEVSLCRSGGVTWMTVSALVGPGEAAEVRAGEIETRLASLRTTTPLPMIDPHPTSQTENHGARTPGEFEATVAAATSRIGAGEFSKLVLAREVIVRAGGAHDPAALFGALREVFPACFCFCAGTPEAAFIGASPELLVRRSGAGVQTVALAGSTRRSSDPAVDDHLGEQLLRSDKDRREHAIVAQRIVRGLRNHAVWVEAGPEPHIVKIANIQHLATPILAQLADPHSAIELAGMLHPTPAVGAEPWSDRAATALAELEQMDRGWYAAPVGWMDATEDGEFCVALRSGVLRDRDAHLFAGVGVVAGSDPAAELAETEVKLGALLPLLT
jgi:isochorismate synthase